MVNDILTYGDLNANTQVWKDEMNHLVTVTIFTTRWQVGWTLKVEN